MRYARKVYKEFLSGSLVLVKRGKCAGSLCFVVGIDEKSENNAKILIADGKRISASHPKRKSAKHLEFTGIVSDEIAHRLAEGKFLDDGWLCEVRRRLTS